MPRKLIRHGTNTGYRAEIAMGEACRRCHNAHLVYQTQYSKEAKAKGIKYKGDQVIDHLYGSGAGPMPSRPTPRHSQPGSQPSPDFGGYTVEAVPRDPEPSPGGTGPTLLERIASLRVATPDNEAGNEYVEDSDYPDYITPDSVDPDPDPDGQEYTAVPNDSAEYIINAAGMAKIEDSLGTYLSIFGITMEMVDPYCGPVLAENMDNIVRHWAKVIAKYPKAAELFMDGKGGTLMTWIGALQATWPFLFAIYQHHFSKDIQTSGGNIYKKNNGKGRFDPTMPPFQDDFTYTAG